MLTRLLENNSKNIYKNLPAWVTDRYQKDDVDVIISTRARLARNIKGYPYLFVITEEEKKEIIRKVEKAVLNINFPGRDITILRLNNASIVTRNFLKEKFIVTDYLIQGANKEVIFNKNMDVAILVNEEDHIRIQAIVPGFHPKKAYNIVSKIEKDLEKYIEYDFSNEFGYLTACPTNIGTGLRISVMIHLPSINFFKTLNKVIKTLKDSGFTIRGFAGEGSTILGNIYQISNEITLGVTENDIILRMQNAIKEIVKYEEKYRNMIRNNKNMYKIAKENVVRSYNILKYSKSFDLNEAFENIATLRFGLELGMDIDNINYLNINKLFLLIQPIHLQRFFNYPQDKYNKDVERRLRAKLIQKYLKKE